ncbi:Acetyltransferase (GNAT) family protein [Paraoerskovia marina]|uniref:Acetyltransferase (GNAT) family protein n=1 Tax=Paraoerskovia marina TaxID=545619 RepID=A0A1H1SMH3_9CELL|nr:GNAT family N-acetyltransferase [Paraoerskovia marina]SDS49033.1 Acetyltransferase (GNAT) family protein [Paraoerskovia marina]
MSAGAGPLTGLAPRWRTHPWLEVDARRRGVRACWSSAEACLVLTGFVDDRPGMPTPAADQLAVWGIGAPVAAAELILDVAERGQFPGTATGPSDGLVVGGCVPRGMPVLSSAADHPGLPALLTGPTTSDWDWFSTTVAPAAHPGEVHVRELVSGTDREAAAHCLAEANPHAEADPWAQETRWWGYDDGSGLSAVVGAHVRPDGWELGGIGTLPAARGRGSAGALVAVATREALRHADRAALGMYAHNVAGRALYTRAGYVVGQEFSGWRTLPS